MTNGKEFYAIMTFSIAIENIWLACGGNRFTLMGGIYYEGVFFIKFIHYSQIGAIIQMSIYLFKMRR